MDYFQSEQTEERGGSAPDVERRSEQAETDRLRDRLTGALIGIARAADGNAHLISPSATAVIVEGLAAARTGAEPDRAVLEALLERAGEEKRKMVPNCFACASPCGRTGDYDMTRLDGAEPEIREVKRLILSRIREAAAEVCRGAVPREESSAAERLFYDALTVIGMEDHPLEELQAIAGEAEKAKVRCLAYAGETAE